LTSLTSFENVWQRLALGQVMTTFKEFVANRTWWR